VVFDSSRGSTRESCVSRPPTRVAPTESDSSPRHDDESHVGGWPDSSDSSDSLDSVGGRMMCYGGRDATRPTCTVCEGEDARLVRLVRLVGLCRPKMSHTADATRPRL
jgi:hypothetical protein